MLTDVSTADTFTNEANWQGVDNVPTVGSDNLVKSGGVAGYVSVEQNTLRIGEETKGELVGQIEENPTYIELQVDSHNRIIYARLSDGTKIEYCAQNFSNPKFEIAGVNILSELANKLNTQEGMTLISEDVANIWKLSDNPTYIDVETDKDGRMISATTASGVRINFIHTNFKDGLSIYGNKFDTEYSPTYVEALIDKEKRLISAVSKDGTFNIHKLKAKNLEADSLGKHISQIIEYNYGNKNRLHRTIYVAANDSSDIDKVHADYICDGHNDEVEINKAIVDADLEGTVYLCGGTFYIDSFSEYENFGKNAIVIPKPKSGSIRSIIIKGDRHYFNGTRIVVRESAFESVEENEIPNVINVLSNINLDPTKQAQAFWYVSIQDMFICLPNYNHAAVVINLQNAGCGEEKNLRLSAFGLNEYPEYFPKNFKGSDIVDGLVGIRAFHGWTYGDTTRFDNICCWGFRTAFQLGGEHIILNSCRARYNYRGFSFGEYHNECLYGAFDHPLTLINCCDEHSTVGMLFDWCGLLDTANWASKEDSKKQCITLIDFNTEKKNYNAEETVVGEFCGSITFSCGDGVYGNYKDVNFWKPGHGHSFKTVNTAHSLGGTTAERRTYIPQYMQQYYDTDLSKMLIYDGNNWVDYNGNINN